MSDQGEKMCPLCAEEMDLTDQQLKPCKCGYEICVWCWHHVMDMAEKDETEGRCPACRAPYNKEKIVGMAAKCERLVAEMNMEKKVKSQKPKTKPSEGKKQLSSVRVIQRNLVYIVGLPLSLADEDLLQHKEYFGQYGKVLKVSISRTAAGAIQQFPNNTCSVYITYSKEEEAVRCIQTVHGFVLDSRPLRACFGTTKYCHAWLRSVPCNNPDCLYLHENGPQEDSFTKDEIISAYTRSRVQQITGATNNLQRRSGNVLPPPADDYCINSSASTGKPIVKNVSSNPVNIVRSSPPNSSAGRSAALPAAASWGTRSSNCQQSSTSVTYPNGPLKQKSDAYSGSLSFSSAVSSTTQASALHGDGGKKLVLSEVSHATQPKVKMESMDSVNEYSGTTFRTNASEVTSPTDGIPSVLPSVQVSSPSEDIGQSSTTPPNITKPCDLVEQSFSSGSDGDIYASSDNIIQNLCSELSSRSIEESGAVGLASSVSDNDRLVEPQVNQVSHSQQFGEPLTSQEARKPATFINGVLVSREQCNLTIEPQRQVVPNGVREADEDLRSFIGQSYIDSENINGTTYAPNHSRGHSWQQSEAYNSMNFNVDPIKVDNRANGSFSSRASSVSVLSNGHPENLINSPAGSSYFYQEEGKTKHVEEARISSNAALDIGESSIISNILSMDFDPWDDEVTSPRDFVQLLGENDRQNGSHNTTSSSQKAQNSNQSRFFFARQEEPRNQLTDAEPPFGNISQLQNHRSFNQDGADGRLLQRVDRIGYGNGFSPSHFEELNSPASSHSAATYNKLSGSRAQISAPPGFSVPSRAPPPGFSSHERMDNGFDTTSGNHLHEYSSLRNPYQAPPPISPSGNTGDLEFMDPAILAVGKGRLPVLHNNPGLDVRSNYPQQPSAFENDPRFQMFMQRSQSPHNNLRFSEQLSDPYGISSRLMEQSHAANLSPFAQLSLQQPRNTLMSNNHWDGWNEVQSGNDMGMAELLRNERLGYNKFYNAYEDTKFRMPSSGDLYNRTFGM